MQPAEDTLRALFENAPRFVRRLSHESAASWDELLDRAQEVALALSEDEQAELINSHPRIGAEPATLSAASFVEQGYDHDSGTSALEARLAGLNEAYEERHGFRFVIFVNGRSRAQIADLIDGYLDALSDVERERALRDVIAIARSRVSKLTPEEVR